MPTVRRTVRTAPLPGVRKQAAETPLSTGVGVQHANIQKNEALAGLGNTIARVGADQAARLIEDSRQQADQTALYEAQNTIAKWKAQRLYDPANGALAVKGKDAMPLPELVGAEFEKVATDAAAKLKTPKQRDTFARVRASEAAELDLALRRHVFGQMQAYEQEELKAFVENAKNDAVVNAMEPRRVAENLAKVTDAITSSGPRLGLGPEQVQQALLAAHSEIHVGVIDSLLANNQDKAARVYFEETRDQIGGDVMARVERALHEGNTRGEAQRQSDAIVKAGGTLTEQREKAKAIEDPEVRDQVLNYLEHEDLIRRQQTQGKEEDLMVTAGNLIDKGGIKAVPPGLWAQLTPNQKSGLESYAKRNLKPAGDGDTDLITYYKLRGEAISDPAAFAKRNLLNDMHRIGKTEFKQLVDLQMSIRKGDGKADAILDGFRTNQQIVDDTLDLAGIVRTGQDADHKAVAAFRQKLDEKVMALQRLTGKKVANADVQQLADDLLKSVVVEKGSWLNILPFGASFTDVTKRVSDLTVTDIPARDRAQIEQALRARGRPVTADTILNLYIDTKRRLGELK